MNARDQRIKELIQAAPPLTPEQVQRLRALLPAADTMSKAEQSLTQLETDLAAMRNDLRAAKRADA